MASLADGGRGLPGVAHWQYLVFGIAEPVVNVATTAFITLDSAAFARLLFAGAPSAADHLGAVVPTLCRMYASALLCFGLTQATLWRGWFRSGCGGASRIWMWGMLVPDLQLTWRSPMARTFLGRMVA